MPAVDLDKMDELKRTWTDRYVTARVEQPDLKRFEGRVGRVVTVNYGGKAIVDFADGAWYDIPASAEHLAVMPADDPRIAKFDAKYNSAQAFPEKQG